MKRELALMIAFGLLFAILAFISSSLAQGSTGTDDQAGDIVKDLTGGSYHPWVSSIWQPGAGAERLLFSIQAGIGGIIIGYFVGHRRATAS